MKTHLVRFCGLFSGRLTSKVALEGVEDVVVYVVVPIRCVLKVGVLESNSLIFRAAVSHSACGG